MSYKTTLTSSQMRYGDPESVPEPHRTMLILRYREREAEDALEESLAGTDAEPVVGWEAPNGCVISRVGYHLGRVIKWEHP